MSARIHLSGSLLLALLLGGCGKGTVPTTTLDPSAPGVVWARIDVGNGHLRSVTVGGPGLVAVGEALSGDHKVGAVWVSADGYDWARIPHDEAVFGGPGYTEINAVAAGGPGLVAVGETFPTGEMGGPKDGVVWVSADGYLWSRIEDEAFRGGLINDVAAGGPGVVAVGFWGGPGVWVSADGYSWTRTPFEVVNGWLTDVVAGGPSLVATSGSTAMWASTDGYAWTGLNQDLGYGEILDVAAGGPGLVAVGQVCDPITGGNCDGLVWVSADGFSWTRIEDRAAFGGQTIRAVTAGGPGLVAVGSAAWASADGLSWTRIDDGSLRGMESLVEFGTGLVGVGWDASSIDPSWYSGAVWVSPSPG